MLLELLVLISSSVSHIPYFGSSIYMCISIIECVLDSEDINKLFRCKSKNA